MVSDPRVRALYLAAVAVGAFVIGDWRILAGLLGLQIALWLSVGLGVKPLLRQWRKLSLLLSVIFLAYALVAPTKGAAGTDYVLPWFGWHVTV